MLNLWARWILWDNTYSVLWRKRGVNMDKQVFYADETGLFLQGHWQMNLYNSSGLQTSDFKPFRDRAAMLLCASAKGNFKSKPLRVYRVRSPWAFKGRKLNHMPFIEGWTKKAWMVFEILSGCLGLVPQLHYPRSWTPSPEWKPEYLLLWRTQMCPSECSSFYAPKHCLSSNHLIRAKWKLSSLTSWELARLSTWRKHHDGFLEVSQYTWHNCLCLRSPGQYPAGSCEKLLGNVWPDCMKNFKVFDGVTEKKRMVIKT